MLRRLSTGAAVVIGTLALTASSAFAFECYNTQRSAKGNAAAGAHSQALWTFERILAEEVGLCPEGVAHVLQAVDGAGYRTDVLINFNALMAGGLEKSGNEAKLHDGKGIDHLGDEFFAFVEPITGEAFGICAAA
jgi:hypothetical protein